VPLFKLFTCYEEPWWRAVGVTEGRSLTDLPLRQLYYWAVEGEQPGADPNNTNAVLLATYDDTLNIDFWSGYRTWPMHYVLGGRGGRPLPWRGEPGAPYEQRATPFGQVHAGSEGWREHKAPAAMVREAHRQVKEMHGVPDAPEPYAAAYRDWGDDPFGGGVHVWTAHNKSWEIVPRMVKPLSAFPVYVCGEAYSGTQTWVEGALETAELVLQKHLHLPAPAWARPAAPSGSSGTPPAATPATATPTAAPAAGAGSAARR
jgi:hypothetical protein